MNRNQIINLTVLLSVIGIIAIIVYLNKSIKNKRYDSIKNKINNPKASNELIEMAYHYETGNYPYSTNKKDGTKLEYLVFETVYRLGGKVLSSLYTYGAHGNRNELDVVFVHNTGIYVIECKDTDAISIIGDEFKKDWEYIFNENHKEERLNPLKQNLGHINSLKNALNTKYTSEYYTSVVVINCGDIKVDYESDARNFYQKIVTPNELKSYMQSLINERNEILSDEEVIDIYKYLHENYANQSEEIKTNHIIHIQEINK